MALKDDIEGVKKEIGTEEQFLESVIKSEIFVKKYKKPLIFLAAVLIVAFIGYYANEFLSDRRIASANAIYDELLNKRDDAKLAELKQKDINLYALYILQIAIRLSDFHRQIMAPYSQTSEYCLVPFPPQNQHSHCGVKNNP